jgi:AcrR family transcriptional regulator
MATRGKAKPRKHPKAGPRWQRRKDERPAEIMEAALCVFAGKGFAAAKLDDIAAKAQVAKGLLYLYFSTKEDLFRAVVKAKVSPNLEVLRQAAETLDAPFSPIAAMLLGRAAQLLSEERIGAVARMVIGESRNFPDLARIWHDGVVANALSLIGGVIKRAQDRGEVPEGDPTLYAFSLMGPMLMAVLYREVFPFAQPPDLEKLALQHAEILARGLSRKTEN